MNDISAAQAIAAQIKDFRHQAAVEVAEAASLENQADRKREKAATLNKCASDLEGVLNRLKHGDKPDAGTDGTKKVRLRYQEPGLTADIISMIARQPGIAEQTVLTAMRPKEKSRGTAGKLLGRAVECGDVLRTMTGELSLSPQGEEMWKQSPLSLEVMK